MIYDEDCVDSPRQEVEKLLAYLGYPDEQVNDFMTNYEQHREVSSRIIHRKARKTPSQYLAPVTDEELLALYEMIQKDFPNQWGVYFARYMPE